MKTSDILDQAADTIERRGWRGPDDHDWSEDDPWGGGAAGTGGLCLEGGILAAMGVSLPGYLELSIDYTDEEFEAATANRLERERLLAEFRSCPAYAAVHDYLGFLPNRHLYSFNDSVGRTANEVIETLRAAALIERAKEAAEVKV